jgi:O-antigen biosynthesis protein WbqP
MRKTQYINLEPVYSKKIYEEGRCILYKSFFKRLIDILLSFIGIIILLPVYLILYLAIIIDSPGNAFFMQKRIGIHKSHFNILKFRTMRIDTPHDMPTHKLADPNRYITRVGSFLRRTSLDELPQILQILTGQMSIIGPRPALWNQDDLVAERDKYGANDIQPGLTGWAQINGRDELEIPIKARFDGEYVKRMSFLFDCKCFIGTITSVLRHKGIVEGGTGNLSKEIESDENRDLPRTS